ncbi:MAG: phosphoglycerate mutase, partial [Thermodesulfobacteriota bacterium]
IYPSQKDIPAQFKALKENYNKYDFFYLHVKDTDSRGEDGDFDGKVNVLEKVDRLMPQLTKLKPDVLVVTGDHSTPSKLASHSWHTVPVILNSPYIRRDKVDRFDEISCASGSLVNLPACSLMSLALANALRLTKYGA